MVSTTKASSMRPDRLEEDEAPLLLPSAPLPPLPPPLPPQYASVRRAACILAITSGTYRWTGRQTYREKERTMADLLSLLLELI